MIKSWVIELPWDIIKEVSNRLRVNPLLIGAMVSVESNGDPKATRFESHYKWVIDIKEHARANNISRATEKNLQMNSMGLMQIMGANARYHGYTGPLSDLYIPEVGLRYGVIHLTKEIDKYEKLEDAISSYNQGSPRKEEDGTYENQEYVDKVMSKYLYLQDMI